ncbi:MAG: ArsR family transcriptional regulator [Haloferacaceae archaeon]
MGDDADDAASTSLSPDALFSLLRNRRRRNVLRYLRTADGEVGLRELSEQIAAWENDCPVAAVTYKQRKRVQTALYQIHLPKLAEWGVVDYDRRAGTLELRDGAESCLSLLDGPVSSRPWWKWYLGVAVVGGVVIALDALGVPPFAGVPDFGYAALLAAAFVLLSCAYVVDSRTGAGT